MLDVQMADVDVDVVRLQCGTNATIEIIGISPCSTPSERIVGWIFITQFCVWLYQKKRWKGATRYAFAVLVCSIYSKCHLSPFQLPPPLPPSASNKSKCECACGLCMGPVRDAYLIWGWDCIQHQFALYRTLSLVGNHITIQYIFFDHMWPKTCESISKCDVLKKKNSLTEKTEFQNSTNTRCLLSISLIIWCQQHHFIRTI